MFDLKTDVVQVRGKRVTVKEMTVAQRADVLEAFKTSAPKAQILCVAFCALGDDGTPMFGGDAGKAGELPSDVADAISTKVMELSGLGDDAKN